MLHHVIERQTTILLLVNLRMSVSASILSLLAGRGPSQKNVPLQLHLSFLIKHQSPKNSFVTFGGPKGKCRINICCQSGLYCHFEGEGRLVLQKVAT